MARRRTSKVAPRWRRLFLETYEPRLVLATTLWPSSEAPVVWNNVAYFGASDSVHGFELWKSDGQTTSLVKDINPGSNSSNPSQLGVFQGLLYFQVAVSGQTQIWQTDGTAAGTVLAPGNLTSVPYDHSPTPDQFIGPCTFFFGWDAAHGRELWRFNRTTSETSLVKDINPGPTDAVSDFGMTFLNGTLYFVANDGTHGAELWKSDGTEAGTVMVKDITPSGDSSPRYLQAVNGKLFFSVNSGLWVTDGTDSGTTVLSPIVYGYPWQTAVMNNRFFIGSGNNVWVSDGTVAGTTAVIDVSTAGGRSPDRLSVVKPGQLMFAASAADSFNEQLWKSDGTPSGTSLVTSMFTGYAGGIVNIAGAGQGSIFTLSATFTTGKDPPPPTRQLWRTDGTAAGTSLVTVQTANTPPSGMDNSLTTLEDTAYVFRSADFGFSDANDSLQNQLLNVRITTLPPAGTLVNGTTPVAVGSVIPASAINSGSLQFIPAINANGSAYGAFTFQVQDDGGTANGGSDLDPTPNTITLSVTSVNDAPSADGGGLSLGKYPYAFSYADWNFSDRNDWPPGGISGGNLLKSVEIVTLPSVGTIADNNSPIVAGQFIPLADMLAGKLTYSAPVSNSMTSFAYKVQDDGGTANGGVDLSRPATFTIRNQIPWSPEGYDSTVTLTASQSYEFSAHDFYPNPFTTAPLLFNLKAVQLTTLPSAGSLTDDGAAVTQGQLIPVADLAAGKLRYTPPAGATGSPLTSFTFQVQDDGGTILGRSDLDSSPNTLKLKVVAPSHPNQPPSGADKSGVVFLNSTYTLAAADFGFSDTGDTPANNFLAVKVVAAPAAGLLSVSGAAVTSGQVIPVSQLIAGNVQFAPAANASGLAYATLTFQVQDDGGTANGGVDLDPTVRTITFNVSAASANHAPRGADGAVSMLEDKDYTFKIADFGFSDPNDTPANSMRAIRVLSGLYTGINPRNQIISASDIQAGRMLFPNAYPSNKNGPSYAQLVFQVQDDGGTANSGVDWSPAANTLTINLVTVNDPPVGMEHSVATPQDVPYTFSLADFAFTDTSDVPANSLAAVKISSLPSAGTLTLSAAAMTAGQFVTASDLAAGKLVFTPAAGATGQPYAYLQFQVQDDGGTANGGIDLDPVPRSLYVVVGPRGANHPPHGASTTVTTRVDTPYTLKLTDFGFADDYRDAPPDHLRAIKISTTPTAGTLKLAGTAVSAGQFIFPSDVLGGYLQYVPDPAHTYVPNGNCNPNGCGADYPSFRFQVQDDGGTATIGGVAGVDLDPNPQQLSISIFSISHAPVGLNAAVTTLEDTKYSFYIGNFPFSDPSDSPLNNLRDIKITTVPTNGTLSLYGTPMVGGQTVNVFDLYGGLVFTPAPNMNGTTSLTFQVQDDGGSFNGGSDLDPVPKTLTVNVQPVNDPPQGQDGSTWLLEWGATDLRPSRFNFSDPADNPANALKAVRIVSLPANGTLKTIVFPDPKGFGQETLVTAGQVIPFDLLWDTYYFPNPKFNGDDHVSFQVEDDGGTANGGVDFDPIVRTLTLQVLPVNNAPSGADKTIAAPQGAAYTLTAADFGFTDSDDVPPNNLLTVKITTLPLSGSLTLAGGPVTSGQFVSATDIAAGKLQFVPPVTINANPFTSFTFQVQDDGGTANGGIDLDPTPNTLTFNSLRPAGPPEGLDALRTISEDLAYYFSPADFAFGGTSANLLGVWITSLPTAGTLRRISDNQPISAGDFIPATSISNLKFLPVANANGSPYGSFTFQVQDDGGTAGGRVDLDPTPATFTFNVVATGDPPTGRNFSATLLEDNFYTFSVSDFPFTDADIPPNNLRAIRIATLPAIGMLTVNGNPVPVGDFVSKDQLAAGQLRYLPPANMWGTPLSAFTFQVQDDGGTANGGQDLDPVPKTASMVVTSVNDAPHGNDRSVWLSLTCGQPARWTISASDFSFFDPNDVPANQFKDVIVNFSGPGTLRLFGNPVATGVPTTVTRNDLTSGALVYELGDGFLGPATILTFRVQDDGGTANGGTDTDFVSHNVRVNLVSGTVHTPIGSNASVLAYEDWPYMFGAADFPFTDFCGGNLKSVIVTTLPAKGQLTDNGAPVTVLQAISAVDLAAGKLQYLADPNGNGFAYSSFTFKIQDDTGTANGGIDTDPTPRTLTINVAAVNDPPSGMDRAVVIAQGVTYTISIADFGFSDAIDSPPNLFAGAAITSLPAAGSLTLNGQPISTGALISYVQIAAGQLVYQPSPGGAGTSPGSFTFQVKDNGGTTIGGVDLDPTPNTLTLNVCTFNEHPVGGPLVVQTLEDEPYVFGPADFPLDDQADSLHGVHVTTLPATGSLQLNGAIVAAGQFISAADLTNGNLRYVPPANANGSPLASFLVQLDHNGSLCSSPGLDPTPTTVTINVTPVNDPPSFAAGSNENVTDESGPQSIAGWATAISPGPPGEANQQLQFSVGVTTNLTLFASPPAIDATGNLTFTPEPNASGSAQVTVVLKDNGGTASGGVDASQPQTFTITVTKPHAWHNTANQDDVSADGILAPGDALLVINYINSQGAGPVPQLAVASPPYVDVDGDGYVAPIDALIVINALNAAGPLSTMSEGEAAAVDAAIISDGDLLAMLAQDLAHQVKRRR